MKIMVLPLDTSKMVDYYAPVGWSAYQACHGMHMFTYLLFSGITMITYAHNQRIGKQNTLNVFVCKKAKGLKQDSQNQLRLQMTVITDFCFNINRADMYIYIYVCVLGVSIVFLISFLQLSRQSDIVCFSFYYIAVSTIDIEHVLFWIFCMRYKIFCLSCIDCPSSFQTYAFRFPLCYLVEQEMLTLPEHLSSPLVFFSGVRVTRSLVLYVCFVDRCLSFCPFSFGHCVVCPSSIYGF